MADRHHALRETLLRAGLSPRHIERYLRELREHRDDIAEHLQVTGLSANAARRQAEHHLGDRNALLLPMLADRRFRSLAARWPVVFYLAFPLVLQAGFVTAGVFVLLMAAGTGLRPAMGDLGNVMALLLLANPVIVAWLTLLAARRRRAALTWPILGACVGAALAAALQLGVTLPSPETTGRIGLTLAAPSLLQLTVLVLLSLLPLSLQPRTE